MQGITNAVTSSENSELYYTKSETNALLNNKASTSLDNLSAAGQMIIDSQNGTISNCVLDIPQNIKVTLENNVLTLKSGSILTRDETIYSTINITQDVSIDLSGTERNTRNILFFSKSDTPYARSYIINKICSGATDELAGTGWHAWFDTETKQIKTFGNDGTTAVRMCYPVCVYDVDSEGNVSFVKDSNGNNMIFNGAGFIGHHAFVYPNVKALIVNGFNEDGSLRSASVVNNSLQIVELQTYPTSTRRIYISISANCGQQKFGSEVNTFSDLVQDAWAYQYVKSENLYYEYHSSAWHVARIVDLISYKTSTTGITDFTIRQPYQGARNLLTDDLYKQIGDVETLLAAI